MTIEWIDSVPSDRYQATNTTARAIPNTAELSCSGTPRLSVRLSVTRVPNTLTNVTVAQ